MDVRPKEAPEAKAEQELFTTGTSGTARWRFHFHVLDETRWIAFEPSLGCAFRVNRRARDLIDALCDSACLADAFRRFTQLQPGSDALGFKHDVELLESRVAVAQGLSRRRLTAGRTLVPDRLFSRWSGALAGLVSFPWLLVNLSGLLAALLASLAGSLPQSATQGCLVSAVGGLLLITSVFIHELGHGAALRRFGHRTGAMGIGLYLIYPVFYVEMYTLEALSSRERLWVDAGGAHFQVLFGHGLLCAGLASGANWLVSLAFGIYALAAFQLVPINRSDGYWLLMDFVQGRMASKHVRWISRACLALASVFFITVLAASLCQLWSALLLGQWRRSAVGLPEIVGLVQLAFALFLLARFFLRRRRKSMGDVATP